MLTHTALCSLSAVTPVVNAGINKHFVLVGPVKAHQLPMQAIKARFARRSLLTSRTITAIHSWYSRFTTCARVALKDIVQV